jgi:hypothetical protein
MNKEQYLSMYGKERIECIALIGEELRWGYFNKAIDNCATPHCEVEVDGNLYAIPVNDVMLPQPELWSLVDEYKELYADLGISPERVNRFRKVVKVKRTDGSIFSTFEDVLRN